MKRNNIPTQTAWSQRSAVGKLFLMVLFLLTCLGGIRANVEQTSQTIDMPTDVTVTTTPFTATISWTGTADSYNIQYRMEAIFSDGFENHLNNWTLRNGSSNTRIVSNASFNTVIAYSGSHAFMFSGYGVTSPQYLITHELKKVPEGTTLEFRYKEKASFRIGTSSSTDATEDFTWGAVISSSDNHWHKYSATIPANTKYVCWQYLSGNQSPLYLDDISIYYQNELKSCSTTNNAVTLTGLTPGFTYEYQVQSVAGSETSNWTSPATFTTPMFSLDLTDLTVADLTATTATISWTGLAKSYNVHYRRAAFIGDILLAEGFENGYGGWTRREYGNNTDIYTGTALPVHTGSSIFRFCCTNWNVRMTTPQYLISPEIAETAEDMKLEFWYTCCDYHTETFHVGTSSTGTAIDDFTFGPEVSASGQQWHLYRQALPAGTKYVCLKYTSNQYNLAVDDIRIYTTDAWTTVGTNMSSVTIIQLKPKTEYEYQVQSVVDNETSEWTALASFTTLPFSGLLGDVNGDGSVTPADAIMILYHYFGVAQNNFNDAAADLNDDGTITPADAVEALYMYFRAGKSNNIARSTRPTTWNMKDPD